MAHTGRSSPSPPSLSSLALDGVLSFFSFLSFPMVASLPAHRRFFAETRSWVGARTGRARVEVGAPTCRNARRGEYPTRRREPARRGLSRARAPRRGLYHRRRRFANSAQRVKVFQSQSSFRGTSAWCLQSDARAVAVSPRCACPFQPPVSRTMPRATATALTVFLLACVQALSVSSTGACNPDGNERSVQASRDGGEWECCSDDIVRGINFEVTVDPSSSDAMQARRPRSESPTRAGRDDERRRD